jgi:hypothetical protein
MSGKRETGQTSSKAKVKRAGTPCNAEGCDTNLTTPEAKFTGYCARHQRENRQYCKTEDCNNPLVDLRAMKSGYCTKCSAADFTQPAIWSVSIQTDALGYIIERRTTLDGWASLLLRADIPTSTVNGAAAEAGGRLFNAIADGLHWGARPRVWSNAIDIDIPDDWFDYRVNDVRRIVANGHIKYLARQL